MAGDRSPSPRADVCVVGGGVAGGIVSHKLVQNGYEVVILEAGPRFDFESRLERMERALRPDIDQSVWDMGGERDTFTSSGGQNYPLNSKRVKGVGGTTLHWGGYTPRLHEKDFEMQSQYGLATDWPISYEDLQPYYAEAESQLGVAGADDNPFAPPRQEPFPLPAFPTGPVDALYEEACSNLDITLHSAPQARNSEAYDDRSKCLGYSTCIPVCPSGAQYSGDVHMQKAEAEGARIIDRAPVQYLEHGPEGKRVDAAVYNTPGETELQQEARYFILAAGAVEIPRLLLLSTSRLYPDGLANSSGLVGKYFMEHPGVSVRGRIDKPKDQEPIWWHSLESHQFYNHNELGPGSFKLTFNQNSSLSLTGALTGFDGLVEELYDPVEGDSWNPDQYDPESWTVSIGSHVEMLPKRTNQINLDPSKTDNHGNPVPDIQLDVGPHAIETMKSARWIQTRILEEVGASKVQETNISEPPWGGHHMGTTRMGEDPTASVVNSNLQSHDLQNLFISSSSVFVTGGAMNPTLTIAALSLRLAEYLDRLLGQ